VSEQSRLEGVPLSKGIAFGQIHVLTRAERNIPQYYIGAKETKRELQRLRDALGLARSELHSTRKRMKGEKLLDPSTGAFLDLYEALLEDESIVKNAEDKIRRGRMNAEWALQQRGEEMSADFETVSSEYLRERKHDIEHLVAQVIHAMRPAEARESKPARGAGKGKLLAARTVSPTDVLEYSHRGYEGFATEVGGPNSHAAIIARSLRVPFVGKISGLMESVHEDEKAVLDAIDGALEIRPSESTLRACRAKRRAFEEVRRPSAQRRRGARKAKTADGVQVSLQANIELPEELQDAYAAGADEIGLFRTESLMLSHGRDPGEDEQYESYRAVLKEARGVCVTFRTLDIGGDKVMAGDSGEEIAGSPLGLRAIRYCLSNPQMFLSQLRALLRASAHGPMRIMFPMLTHPGELGQALGLLNLAREQLSNRSQSCAAEIPLGAMIEVPGSVFVMDDFARRLDFFSIGTNDLIQYMLAVDREDEKVATLNDPLHPAVVQMLDMIARKAGKHGKPLTLCGEMAGDAALTSLFVCLGIERLSMQADRLQEIREVVAGIQTEDLRKKLRKLLGAETPEAVRKVLGTTPP